MLDAAGKALAQILTPPFRAVLWKSIGFALLLIAIIGFGFHRLLVWLATDGENVAEVALGPSAHTPLGILLWLLTFAAGAGIVIGSVFLMPAVTSFVASFFVDEIGEQVERRYYPADPVGVAVPLPRAILEGVKTALIAVAIYIVVLPFLLLAGFGAILFFLATAYILGRTYFELAAMRFRSVMEAKAMRRQYAGTIYAAGLLIALFVSIPIVNLATPLFGMALMVHVHKQLSARPAVIARAAR